MCCFPTASDLSLDPSHHNQPTTRLQPRTLSARHPRLTLSINRSDTLKDVPEFFEVELGESLLSRTETLGTSIDSITAHSPLGSQAAHSAGIR